MSKETSRSPEVARSRGENRKALKDVKGITREESDFLVDLLVSYLQDQSVLIEGYSPDRDIATVRDRYATEGFGFISKTLPRFSDWLRRSIDIGTCLPSSVFKNYRCRDLVLPYPAFLRGLVCHIFDASGEVIFATTPVQQEAQKEALTTINTVCNSFGKKYEVPLSEEFLDDLLRSTIEDDSTKAYMGSDYSELSEHAKSVAAFARSLLTQVFEGNKLKGVRFAGDAYDPWKHGVRHGSGSVAHPLAPHEKYVEFPGLPINLDLAKAKNHFDCDMDRWFKNRPDRDFCSIADYSLQVGGIARFEFVPKNSKTGRGICLEPVEGQLSQQGLRMSMYDWVETHPLTRGLVNFTDQGVNRSLVLSASRAGDKATIDLSRASDSVTGGHINLMWPEDIADLLFQVRSAFVMAKFKAFHSGVKCSEVYGVYAPNMFAPMGSAVCFPVEALTFWAILTAHLTLSGARDTRVWVYGDDIILASEWSESAAQILAEFKIKVNESKSFSKGHFRESCGVDAFDGSTITPPARCSTRLPLRLLGHDQEQMSRSVVAWVKYANLFEQAQSPTVASKIRKLIAREVPSSKSYPHLRECLDLGFLYFLDYENGISYIDFMNSGNQERDLYWRSKTSSTFRHPLYPQQGELFEVKPFYQGSVKRVWVQDNPEYEVTLSEETRYLRYMLEGGGPLPGNWFGERKGFRLRRVAKILT